MSYHWPGNVRELGNVLERSILKASGTQIKEVDLPGGSGIPGPSTGVGRSRDYELPLREFLKRAEKDYLASVLRRAGGGIASTSKHAMVDAATLHRKMKQHGLKRESFRRPREPQSAG
jgi:DNA-binding NtrC family response regulator